jgi:hypothetical protein
VIQIRTTYQVKFGKIDQAVDLFRRLPGLLPAGLRKNTHYHLLTDISGPMYTLVEELMVPSVGEWDSGRAELFKHPDYTNWFSGFQLFVEGGEHQFYTVEGDCEDWSKPGVIVVRESYRAHKWQIRPAVDLLRRYGALVVDSGAGRKPRILTDVSGPMFQSVIEIETDNLAHWETQRRSLYKRPEFQVWFVQLTNAVEAGAHEFYRVEV